MRKISIGLGRKFSIGLGCFLLLPAAIVCLQAPAAQAAIPIPGPSQALFNAPYYSCRTNYWVSTSGSDNNLGTTQVGAWATLQHANNALAAHTSNPGTCVNVVASGTSYLGLSLTTGGNAATSTGYLVWRCTKMLGCTIRPSGNDEFYVLGTGTANYTFIDGFDIVGKNADANVGVQTQGAAGTSVGRFASHHVWLVNNSITANGDAGVAFAASDYTYVIHNDIFGNSKGPNCDGSYQGSGLADNVALDIAYEYPKYVTKSDDKVNPVFGSFVTGSTWFHKVYEWNKVFDNHVTPCTGSTDSDSDGNGIILDTFGTVNGNKIDYPDQTLIAFNLVYNNGGAGIGVHFSELATVANNTVFQSDMDADKPGGASGIDTNESYGNTVMNNIVVSYPVASGGTCSYNLDPPYQDFANAILGGNFATGKNPSGKDQPDAFSGNITWLASGNPSCWGSLGVDAPTGENPMFNIDSYSATTNLIATNPLFVDVGTSSLGTSDTSPTGANFALQPGAPAIGYGTYGAAYPFLGNTRDAGACDHAYTTCP